ncbi:hypothetical protein BJV74DRAFT_879404 [Russula compacta]|nr:hypothetical protein BJV74DRAFT_879404 [Russula compacta]
MVNPLGSQTRPSYPCPICHLSYKSPGGLTHHQQTVHCEFTPMSENDAEDSAFSSLLHPQLNVIPCDENGNYLPHHTPPPPFNTNPEQPPNCWEPFDPRVEYEFAHYHFMELQSLAANIDKALDLWAVSVMECGKEAPWANSVDLYKTIDAIQHGDAPWKTYQIQYQGPHPPGTPPKWMTETYQLCTQDSHTVLHNQLATSDFHDKISYVPYRQFNSFGECVWSNLMSADWSWSQADKIVEDATNQGAMFVPVIARSDKTTISVASGHQEYHPIYMSPGNLMNTARRAHGNSVLPVVKCPNGHFRCAVYGLGPYIADYLEQVWLAAIVQGWCPKCDAHPENLDVSNAQCQTHETTDFLIHTWDPSILWTNFGVCTDIVPFTHEFPCDDIHELLTPDLLHQVIKGTFKDHLVMWVNKYLYKVHREAWANEIIEDINHWFQFPDGRNFTQWTGDDSKALIKVYLSAVAGHIPSEMVKCISVFLDFCYIAQCNALTSTDLEELQNALTCFHHHWEIFVGTASVNGDQISLPRQHSLMHYLHSIQLFGSPNGLCSSITESKHIKAVKEPWRHSSRYKALKQMLVMNIRLDKLASAGHVFAQFGMMEGTASSYTAMILRGESPQPREIEDKDDNEDDGPVAVGKLLPLWYPWSIKHLADHIQQPKFPKLLWRFLYNHVYPNAEIPSNDLDLDNCPHFGGNIYVYHSAVAHFYAPSDLCGASGMYQEWICSNPSWQQEYARHDTMFVAVNPDIKGMQGMHDEDTGLWVVEPEFEAWAAHLLPVYGLSFIPEDFHFSDSLDAFRAYFVN